MHARVDRHKLAEGLALCQLSADPRSTIKAMAHVLLWCDMEGELRMATMDGSLATTHVVTGEVAENPIGVCVEAKRFFDVIKGLDAAQVVLSEEAGRISISTERAKYALPTLSGREFPKLFQPPHDMQTVEPSLLAEMLAYAAHAMHSDNSRMQFDGLQIDGDGEHVDVLACAGSVHSSWHRQPMSLKLSAHVPFKGVKLLRSMLEGRESAYMGKAEGQLFVRGGATTIAIKLLDHHPFAPVRDIIHEARGVVLVDKSALARAASLMLSVGGSGAENVAVDLHIGHRTLLMQAESASTGVERIDIQRVLGDPFSVRVIARAMVSALAAHKEEKVRIETGFRKRGSRGELIETGLAFRSADGVSIIAVIGGHWGDKEYSGPPEEPRPPASPASTAPPTSAKPKSARAPAKKAGPAGEATPAATPGPAPAPASEPASPPHPVSAPAAQVPAALLERATALGKLDAEKGRQKTTVKNAVAILVGGEAMLNESMWPGLLAAYSAGFDGVPQPPL